MKYTRSIDQYLDGLRRQFMVRYRPHKPYKRRTKKAA